VYEDNF